MMYNHAVAAPGEPVSIMRRITLLAVLLVSLGSAPTPRAQSRAAPADSAVAQTVVPRLANFASLATILNLARGTVRSVAVVSPASAGAEAGLQAVASILDGIPSKRLRAYVILSSTNSADTQARALDLAARHVDRRIVYVWDPGATVTAAMAGSEGLGGAPTRDVLLLYDTAATFTTVVPPPVAWLALDGAPVDPGALRARADEMVRAVERKASGATSGSE
jgi:hypothetical protein